MKFTLNWLKEFVEVKGSPEELADSLTMAGLEVKSREAVGDDVIFEAEVTSNRPDWLYVVGIAREVAALAGKRLRQSPAPYSRPATPSLDKRRLKEAVHLTVSNDDKKDCPVYTVQLIRNVRVGASPAWLKTRLELIGCRSVNNVVDITNYCMFTWGQPMHAFDLGTFADETVVVRRGKDGEKLTLIDGTVTQLSPDILVIASSQRAVAVAGIMGGKETEVGDSTRDILLEAAVFNPLLVRRGKRLLNLQSDSSYRFERGVDAEQLPLSVAHAVRLIQELAGGELYANASSAAHPARPRSISLDLDRAQRILGIEKLTPEKIRTIFDSLGFSVRAQTKSALIVDIPSFRQDVTQEADLIEEAARIFGYERIPVTLPSVAPQPASGEERRRVRKVRQILISAGLQEVITHSLIAGDALVAAGSRLEDAAAIENPLSSEQEFLRPSIIPGLLHCVSVNLNQRQPYVSVFEIADVFRRPAGGRLIEEQSLAIAMAGERSIYSGRGVVKDDASLLHLKGIFLLLCERLGVGGAGLKPRGRSSVELFAGDAQVGVMSIMAGSGLERFAIKHKAVMLLELSLEKLLSAAVGARRFEPLPHFPGMTRDISFVVSDAASADEMLRALKQEGGALLRDVSVIDYYSGAQIPRGSRGITISCLYRSDERTLTDEEIAPLHERLCALLSSRFGARIRA